MAGIYIHIPFCKQACHYCDFHFSTSLGQKGELINALLAEITLQRGYLDAPVETIYFGGGTPSVLTAAEISVIIEQIASTFTVSREPEITLEANPDDLSDEKLDALRKTGVNRLSIGIQSFDNEVLRFLNRVHNADDAQASVIRARKAGFENISIDLIFGIPGQHDELWKENIEIALALSPEHFSAYGLTIEDRTVFGNWSRKGKLHPVSEDVAARQLEFLMDRMEPASYEQYEISNYCKPGLQSRHNSSYWKGVHYLGLGPSAHSFNGSSRQFNVTNNSIYMKSIVSGSVPAQKEVLTRENKINEFIFTTLRTSWGCDLSVLASTHGYDLLEHSSNYVEQLTRQELAMLTNSTLTLTRKGRLLADKIAAELFTVV